MELCVDALAHWAHAVASALVGWVPVTHPAGKVRTLVSKTLAIS